MKTTILNLQDQLPLTCSRAGTCCHGNLVLLNPWELFCLAKEKKMTTSQFRELYTDFGGVQLKFNGKSEWKGKQVCNLYVENFGCSVHTARPLACRLFPIGRQIQNTEVQYMYQGENFPCLTDCPEVLNLPKLSLGDYLNGQEAELFEKAQDEYLELMQNLADMAFAFFLDTGLAESGDTKTLKQWQALGKERPEELVKRIGQDWLAYLMIPEISLSTSDPISFVQQHTDILQNKVQEQFGNLTTNQEFHEASILLMGIALQLARGIGANPSVLAEHWVGVAEEILENKSI